LQATATAKYLGVPPRKIRLILDVVRGKKVDEALATLTFMQSPAARLVARVVKSASANAENNLQLSPSDLHIAAIYAGDGPRLKRFRPRARGRAGRIVKRSSHVTVVVSEKEA